MEDESIYHELIGYTLRCAAGEKVRGGDAYILQMDAPHNVSNDRNSSNLSSFQLC